MTRVRPASSRAARRLRPGAALLLAAIATAAGGCFNPFKPQIGSTFGVYVPPPARDTPIGVVRLLEWAYERRDYEVYKTLFTEDYQFYFDPADSFGNLYRQDPWIRQYELESALHLFVGGSATEDPASKITLDYTSAPFVEDTGDTLDQTTHRRVTTQVFLEIVAGGTTTTVSGPSDFYVVQFSAAKVPADIRSRVTSGDWFIYAQVDRTLPPTGLQAAGAFASQPGPGPLAASWGSVKHRYRRRAPPRPARGSRRRRCRRRHGRSP